MTRKPKAHAGRVLEGPAGTATEVIVTRPATKAQQATVASWLLHCPGQSPAWHHYLLATVHLRPIPGTPPPSITVPGATHEVMLAALDSAAHPVPERPDRWVMLRPMNAVEQVHLPSDGAAAELLEQAAKAVLAGVLPAEPPLSGQREPWHTSMIKTSAHLRGEEHAP
jgi:hypothetical protein